MNYKSYNMNICDISIIVPSLRPQNWERFLESCANSCTKFSYQVIFIGPFANENILNQSRCNVRFIRSYSTVPICLQIACNVANGKYLFHTVDDGILLPNSLDICLEQNPTIMNARYMEGDGFSGYEFPMQYWRAGTYPNVYGQKFINPDWTITLQPIINRELYYVFGGIETKFEYSNHGHADLSFRLQKAGLKIEQSPISVSSADHGQIDHQPIQDAQEGPDTEIFNQMWNIDRECSKKYFDYDSNNIWKRRFPLNWEAYFSYEDLCEKNGYKT